MKTNDKVIINDVCIEKGIITIYFETNMPENIEIESWLESKNKYNPNIFHMKINNKKKIIFIDNRDLNSFIKNFPQDVFKLSLATSERRIEYKSSIEFEEKNIGEVAILLTENFLFFINSLESSLCLSNKTNSQYNNVEFKKFHELPLDVLSIGSCFSRNIFKSDEYFNPTYKKYFNLKKTLFHNSFISLFSNPIDYRFYTLDDLITGDAALYTAIEFEKNIEEYFMNNNYNLVVIDNYIDATSPIIKFGSNSFLTYNRYLAESIFKRLFASCEVIYPGTKQHLDLYRRSIICFNNLLKKYDIKNVILIGGRQSKFKINEKSQYIDIWNDKIEWISNVNKNWDEVDKIFLEEIEHSIYIDKRITNWKSDIFSPILGGASPSHYQSGYYKELFNDIIYFLG